MPRFGRCPELGDIAACERAVGSAAVGSVIFKFEFCVGSATPFFSSDCSRGAATAGD